MNALDRAQSIEDLRRLARHRLPRGVFDFFDGAADDESTLEDNRRAFERRRLSPRVLRDVSQPDLTTAIGGVQAPVPIVIAPMGATGAGWPHSDVAVARAAAALGIPFTLSTVATSTIEQVREQAGGRLWFQLYVLHDQAFTDQLLRRAAAADYEALVVTLDLATAGKRERDLRNGFTVPMRPTWRSVIDYAAHPGWMWRQLRSGLPRFRNLDGFQGRREGNASVAAMVARQLDAGFSWPDLARIRDRWKGALHVKGVVHPEDAARLAGLGVDAIWVSNHGGRQLDGATASVDALAMIAPAVAGRVPLLLDSGVRRGTDIVKAIALGAQAVAIGRACLYGAAAAGEPGARRALDILTDEFRRAMQLCGAAEVSAISPALLTDALRRDGDGAMMRGSPGGQAAARHPEIRCEPRGSSTSIPQGQHHDAIHT